MREDPVPDGPFRVTFPPAHHGGAGKRVVLAAAMVFALAAAVSGPAGIVIGLFTAGLVARRLLRRESFTIEVDPDRRVVRQERRRFLGPTTWTCPCDAVAEVLIEGRGPADDRECAIGVVLRDETTVRTGYRSGDRVHVRHTAERLAAAIGCPCCVTRFPLGAAITRSLPAKCLLVVLCRVPLVVVAWGLSRALSDIRNIRDAVAAIGSVVVFGIPLALLAGAAARDLFSRLITTRDAWTDPARRRLHVRRIGLRGVGTAGYSYDAVAAVVVETHGRGADPPVHGVAIVLDDGQTVDTGYRSDDPDGARTTAERLAIRIGCPRPSPAGTVRPEPGDRILEAPVRLTFAAADTRFLGGLLAALGCVVGLLAGTAAGRVDRLDTLLVAVVSGLGVGLAALGYGGWLVVTGESPSFEADHRRRRLRVEQRRPWGTAAWECELDQVRDVVLSTDATGDQHFLHEILLVLDRGRRHETGLLFLDRARARASAARIARAIGCPCTSPVGG